VRALGHEAAMVPAPVACNGESGSAQRAR
jgi:hypothetical protein